MSTLKNIVIGVGVGGGLIALTAYLLGLKRTGIELLIENTVMVHKVDLSGISLRIDSTLKNPTRMGLKIKFPFVKLLYKDAVIGSSQVVDKDITIPSYGEGHIEGIMVQIPLTSIFSLAANLLSALQGTAPVLLKVRTLTSIDLGIKQVPYETSQEITLKKDTNGSTKK